MTEVTTALAGFAGWTLILALTMITFRLMNAFGGAKIALNQFSPGGSDLPGFGQRITRAHLNCIETLPVFAGLVVAAALAEQLAVMEGTVMYILYARLAQSLVHVASTAVPMVFLRGGLFTVQVVLMLYYAYQLLM